MGWFKWISAAGLVALSACGRDEPAFLSVLAPDDTFDTVGPYRVEARVAAPNGVHRFTLRLSQGPESVLFAETPMIVVNERHDGGEYYAEFPGRPAGTSFRYYLVLVDGEAGGGGALVSYPDAAPEDLLEFEILYP